LWGKSILARIQIRTVHQCFRDKGIEILKRYERIGGNYIEIAIHCQEEKGIFAFLFHFWLLKQRDSELFCRKNELSFCRDVMAGIQPG
jgi:hypothetical protein